ncbi:unnamed protein product, partial [Polarella glacialis]
WQRDWQSSANWKGMSAGAGMLYPVECMDGCVRRAGGRDAMQAEIAKQKGLVSEELAPAGRGMPANWSGFVKSFFGRAELPTSPGRDEFLLPHGCFLATESPGKLRSLYPEGVLHAVVPYHNSRPDWEGFVKACYKRILRNVLLPDINSSNNDNNNNQDSLPGATLDQSPLEHAITRVNTKLFHRRHIKSVATPFLGTGVRAVPLEEGIRLAAEAVKEVVAEAEGEKAEGTVVVAKRLRFSVRQEESVQVAEEIFSKTFVA